MSERKIKLLAIAPNENIKNLLYEIASTFPSVHMDAYEGNLINAVGIVRQCAGMDYDAILARGETAAMIRQVAEIPVIDIPISFDDILHAMKLADNFHEPYAIVGFTPVTSKAHLLRDLLQLDLEIHTLFRLEDAAPLLENLRQKGFRLIVSGMGIDVLAQKYGIRSIQIVTSGGDIYATIDQAVRLCRSLVRIREQNYFLNQLLTESNYDLLIFNQEKELIQSSLKTLSRENAVSLVTKRLQNLDDSDYFRTKTQGDLVITIQEKRIARGDETCVVYYFYTQNKPFRTNKNGIRTFSFEEATDTFLTGHPEISFWNPDVAKILPQITRSPLPVMLLGEAGTGKEQLAASIYIQGHYRNHPYQIIDFDLADNKTFSYLYNHVDSSLNSNETTIYFRGLEKLDAEQTDWLKTTLMDSKNHVRNRIIFSFATLPNQDLPPCVTDLINRLNCLTVRIPPLRECRPAIPNLASLYISMLPIGQFRPDTDFTPQAVSLLRQYPWPGNLAQFKRVVTQLATCAASDHIAEDEVRNALHAEGANPSAPSTAFELLDIHKPLWSIEKDIARAVLAEAGGNQTQAAARLGICRTTLWKMLKE